MPSKAKLKRRKSIRRGTKPTTGVAIGRPSYSHREAERPSFEEEHDDSFRDRSFRALSRQESSLEEDDQH